MIEPNGVRPPSLSKVVGRMGLFTLSFGGMVGSAWIVILGQWLDQAGPLGAILGLSAAAALMIVVSFAYAELGSRMPAAGGEIVYALETFGLTPAFFTGWVLTVPFVVVTAFEGIALTWIVSIMIPGFANQAIYHVLGRPVTGAQLLVGAACILVIAGQNYRGVRNAVTVQNCLTIGFFVVALSVLGLALCLGHVSNLYPLVREGAGISWRVGAFSIFATGLVWFAGFQAVPQLMEERAETVSYRAIAAVMALSVAVAGAFYGLAILAVSMAKPWPTLLGAPMATIAALQDLLPGGLLAKVVLWAGALAVLKAWNSTFTVAVRTVFVQARAGFFPRGLAAVHPRYKSPFVAIVAVAVVNMAGVALGAGAITPLINVGGICIGVVMIVAVLALLVARLREPGEAPPYGMPGGLFGVILALIAILFMGGAAMIAPFLSEPGRFPMGWALLLAWMALGRLVWMIRRPALIERSLADTRARLDAGGP
jgi:amino acid transporter